MTKRSARLLTEEPRVGAGALVGRVATAIALGFVGELTGELAGLGLVLVGIASRSAPLLIGLSIFGVLVRVGFAALGVAIGAALFGHNFGADLRAAMPVAAISVASAVIVGLVLSLLFPSVSPLLLTGVPLLAAAIATPLIVQARKSDVGATVMKDALPMHGAVISF